MDYEIVLSNGYPVLRGGNPVFNRINIPNLNLKIDDQVIQIGKKKFNTSHNPRFRVNSFKNPIIYKGTIYVYEENWMAFEYWENGIKYHLLYIYDKNFNEIYLPNYTKLEIRIFRPIIIKSLIN